MQITTTHITEIIGHIR